MVDDPDARAGADSAHLETCAECQARFKAVSDDATSIASMLAVPDLQVDTHRAFQRVMNAPRSQPALGLRFPVLRPVSRPTFALVAAVVAAAVVLMAFTFSGFFFRPTTVTPVAVTVADVQALAQLADYGTITWTKEPQFQIATTAADASAVAGGLHVPVVANGKLPAGVSTTVTYGGMSQAVATFTFSADKAAAAAARQGKTLPGMPKGIDGATLTITVGPAVGEIFGQLNQPTGGSEINLPQLVIARSAAPTATSTQVTVSQLENYILSQPGISKELKSTIKSIGDPSKTLLIPIPVNYTTSQNVTVQGVQGVALGDNTGIGAGVVWVKGGSVYFVAGSIKQSEAIDIANNLK